MARDYSTIFTNLKAGMEGLSAQDKERIRRVGTCMRRACMGRPSQSPHAHARCMHRPDGV